MYVEFSVSVEKYSSKRRENERVTIDEWDFMQRRNVVYLAKRKTRDHSFFLETFDRDGSSVEECVESWCKFCSNESETWQRPNTCGDLNLYFPKRRLWRWEGRGRRRLDRATLAIWRSIRNVISFLSFELEMKFNEIPHGGNWIVSRKMTGWN